MPHRTHRTSPPTPRDQPLPDPVISSTEIGDVPDAAGILTNSGAALRLLPQSRPREGASAPPSEAGADSLAQFVVNWFMTTAQARALGRQAMALADDIAYQQEVLEMGIRNALQGDVNDYDRKRLFGMLLEQVRWDTVCTLLRERFAHMLAPQRDAAQPAKAPEAPATQATTPSGNNSTMS